MGLRFPDDLEAWRRWQAGRHPLRRWRDRLRPRAADDRGVMWVKGTDPGVVAILDSGTDTNRRAVLAPLAELTSGAVWAPADLDLRGDGFTAGGESLDTLGPRAIVALGHYLPLGAQAHAWAAARAVDFWVVQHGLLTPYAPPLPARARLLAWSEADADFWGRGRPDIRAEVVGGQLLWEAARTPRPTAAAPPVWLGQLHGAELPRRVMARVAERFCRTYGARYRPHPAETDRLARWQHRRWQARGIEFATARTPLAKCQHPVVAAFSTGIVEAAARGLPAWAYWPESAPAWLQEFWERYGMARWGGPPTPPPTVPRQAPAAAIAARIASA